MKQIVTLAILAIVLFLAYSEGLPWIQQQMGGESGDGGGEAPARCVHQAERANDTFGDNVGRVFTPGGDPDAWDAFVERVRSETDDARSLCRCREPACEKATEAMDHLGELLDQYDERFRSGGGMSSNPAQELLRMHRLLTEARQLAR